MNLILKKLVQEEVQNLIISHQGAIRALVKDMLVSEIRRAIRLEMPGLLDEAAPDDCAKIAPDNQAHCPSARAPGRSPAPTVGQNDNTLTDCRYLYAIAGSEKIIHLGPVGIEDAPVYLSLIHI